MPFHTICQVQPIIAHKMGRDWWLLTGLVLLVVVSSASGQGGAVDMPDQDTDASNDMDQSLSDPSLVNPTNKQGYGRNVQTQIVPRNKNGKTTSKPSVIEKNLGEQTVQAALQFGVLVRFFTHLFF